MKNKYIEAIKFNVLASQYKTSEAVSTTLCESKFARYFGAVPTWHLKFTLNEPCRKIRHELRKLEKQGLVISITKDQNRVDWWPVGFLDELKAR